MSSVGKDSEKKWLWEVTAAWMLGLEGVKTNLITYRMQKGTDSLIVQVE